MLPTDGNNNRRRYGLIHLQLWFHRAWGQLGQGITQYVANLRPDVIGLVVSNRFIKLDTDDGLTTLGTGVQLLKDWNFPQGSFDRFADQGFHALRSCTRQKGHNHSVAFCHLRIFLARKSGKCGSAKNHNEQHQ